MDIFAQVIIGPIWVLACIGEATIGLGAVLAVTAAGVLVHKQRRGSAAAVRRLEVRPAASLVLSPKHHCAHCNPGLWLTLRGVLRRQSWQR